MEKSRYSEHRNSVDDYGSPGALRRFVFTRSFTRTMRVFSSEENLRLYKQFKGKSVSDNLFPLAKQTQNQSKGMPLLVQRRGYGIGLGDISFLKIYQCLPSPESRDRLYDKVDDFLFAEVKKRAFPSYDRFRLKFESTEIVMILHRRYPIADFQVGQNRYRFVRDRSLIGPDGYFSSDLYLLDQNQDCLVDNLTKDLKVNKNNKLLGNSARNLLLPVSFKPLADFISPYQLGQLVNTIFLGIGMERRDCTLSLVSNGVRDFDDNSKVEFEAIVIICASLVLNLHDEERESRKSRQNWL